MTDLPPLGRRVVVVGATGSGKSTLAAELARRLGCEHAELDALHWEKGWTEADEAVFRQRADEATSGDCWVVDGNYSKVRDIVWGRGETLVWLDYPRYLVMWRLLKRTLRRTLGGQELWNGNRERFADQFLSRNSLFLWAWQTHPLMRERYPEALKQPRYAHLKLIRLTSPRETERLLAAL